MLQPCHSYLDINTSDIWSFEYQCYFDSPEEFNGFSRSKIISKLYDKIKTIAYLETKPFITYQNFVTGDADQKRYYESKLNRFLGATDFSDYIRLEYFFANDDGYSCFIEKMIPKDDIDFGYWFALKIRQYELAVQYINDFLEYHLTHSFDRYIIDYIDFLQKRILRQYQGIFFSSRVADTVKEYLESYANNPTLEIEEDHTETMPVNKNKKRIRTREHYNAYHLSILKSNPDYLQGYGNGVYHGFLELIKHRFIDANEDKDYDNFKKLFSGKGVTKSKRCIWLEGNIYLKLFVRYMLQTGKIEPMGNENWTTTIKCFLNKKGEEFEVSKLKHANGGVPKKIELLYSIVDSL
ncbi:hypothetical protein [Aquimarina sp. RZ0]|uniref:hypothetical protein n=1 Tax=Aquimarina sp. RZ0 TaxID=2607730 RepID=UPI0011F0ACA9|nr:hypothetical protein [Aquimarina sp. RZ0]KAA1243325.1 hypothetical protein F0000_21495 [Aquimarina sp. RZ0]